MEYYFLLAGMGVIIAGTVMFIIGTMRSDLYESQRPLTYRLGLLAIALGAIGTVITIGVSVKLWTRQWSGTVSPGSWTSAT